MLDFVMLVYGLDFKGAKNYLRIDDASLRPVVETVPVAWLLCDFAIDGVNYRAAVKDEPMTYREKIRRFYHGALDQMAELGPGESEAHETCWTRLALAFDELRELEAVR